MSMTFNQYWRAKKSLRAHAEAGNLQLAVLHVAVRRLFKTGLDTYDIGIRLGIDEFVAERALHWKAPVK